MTTEEKKQALDEIAKKIAATKGGPLAMPGINPVPGEGNPDAKIILIGEAPGFNENIQMRPFVGQSGKLMRKNLVACGFSEGEVYITNIVKFRPPENRDPTPAEIAFFQPFLDEQISIIGPEYIVTLGRFSMYKFLGENISIGRIHGIPAQIDWQGKKITIFPMFHPAAALRAGGVMRQFESDFKKLTSLINGSKTATMEPQIELVQKNDVKQLELI